MEAVSIQKKKKKKLWFSWILRFHIFSREFYWIVLLQIPEMDSQPNPGPKIPQEDLDKEVRLHVVNVIMLCTYAIQIQTSTPAGC